MNTFSKSLLAITGLALSLAACAPAFKGEAAKKVKPARLFKAEEKARKEQAEANAHIGSVKRSAKETEEGYKFTLKLENVPDLKKKTYEVALSAEPPKDRAVLEAINGKLRRYSVEVQCFESCEKLVAVITSQPLPSESTVSNQEEAAPAVEEEPAATDEASSEPSEEKENLIDTQVGNTAPEVNLEKLKVDSVVKTGVVAKDDKVLVKIILDADSSFEENIQELLGFDGKKQLFNLN